MQYHGIVSYKFEYKKKIEEEKDWKLGEKITSTENSCNYTYINLLSSTEYDLKVTVMDFAGNSNIAIKSVQTDAVNTQPIWVTQSYMADRTTSSITIKAKATDNEETTLNYILHYGTSSDNMDNVKTKTKERNTEVSFQLNDLSEYTTYYWRVDVEDGRTETIEGANASDRTLCSGTGSTCPGAGIQVCPECNGTGGWKSGCDRNLGTVYMQYHYIGAFECSIDHVVEQCGASNPTCEYYFTNHYFDSDPYASCGKHNNQVINICSNHFEKMNCNIHANDTNGQPIGISVDNFPCTKGTWCSTCNGLKEVHLSKCKHNKTTEHVVCSHGYEIQH